MLTCSPERRVLHNCSMRSAEARRPSIATTTSPAATPARSAGPAGEYVTDAQIAARREAHPQPHRRRRAIDRLAAFVALVLRPAQLELDPHAGEASASGNSTVPAT